MRNAFLCVVMFHMSCLVRNVKNLCHIAERMNSMVKMPSSQDISELRCEMLELTVSLKLLPSIDNVRLCSYW